jgi:hypothetical protein
MSLELCFLTFRKNVVPGDLTLPYCYAFLEKVKDQNYGQAGTSHVLS